MFISVTRMRLKGYRMLPIFFLYTTRATLQSNKAKGLIHSSFEKEGWHTFWTLTVWDDKDCMKEYRNNGNHLKAMKIARKIASELEFTNWENNEVPKWNECKTILHEKYGRNIN
ncbi:hypothetical protein D0U04_07660 [Bacillus clarus]|uniref:DUF3291 domain-containing protein n=1 Tax=Bacillus clarus TaxID=2338372 RepID=A0A090YX50_9BACI|nr:hypothetical protein [Bacillus clarus]KFN02648.1 hypothetical protein DJ93_4870 [Bacillus clarus]RFT67635.1 hypothetical protein D0U04_07660 [Bacillus clarus]